MRFILIFVIFYSNFALASSNNITTLHHQIIDDYDRHKEDYERLGLAKGTPRTEACIASELVSSESLQNLPLFDASGSFKYNGAVLHSIGIEKNGVCFTFAGLNKNHFSSWLQTFILNNSNISAGSYVVEFK